MQIEYADKKRATTGAVARKRKLPIVAKQVEKRRYICHLSLFGICILSKPYTTNDKKVYLPLEKNTSFSFKIFNLFGTFIVAHVFEKNKFSHGF